MAEHAIAHFHNGPGVPEIRVSVREFMCIGAPPPYDHPHIYIDLGSDGDGVCSYCSTRFVYDPSLRALCAPAECQWTDKGVAA
jgi:uncharacterized Zn-finger protein